MIEFGSVIVLSLCVCGRVLRSSSIITIRQYFKFDSQKLKTNNTKLTIDLFKIIYVWLVKIAFTKSSKLSNSDIHVLLGCYLHPISSGITPRQLPNVHLEPLN